MNLKQLVQRTVDEHKRDHKATLNMGECSNPLCQLAFVAANEFILIKEAVEDLELQWNGTQRPPMKNITTTGLRDAVLKLVELVRDK